MNYHFKKGFKTMKYNVKITRTYTWFEEIETDNQEQLEQIIFENDYDENTADYFETDYEIEG